MLWVLLKLPFIFGYEMMEDSKMRAANGHKVPDSDVILPPTSFVRVDEYAAPTGSELNEWLPLIIMTGIFGGLFIIIPFFVRKGPNQGIIRCSVWLTLFSLWLFWATVYIAQMRPLLGPRMHNTSIAWMKHAWN